MTKGSSRARVVAAAIRAWTRGAQAADAALRLDIRRPGDWQHVATINLGRAHADRVLHWLRDDLAAQNTPEDYLDAWLAARLADGRRTIHTADLLDVAHHLRQTKTWLARQVDRLADTGRLTPRRWRPGAYRITTPPAWAIRPGTITARSRSTR